MHNEKTLANQNQNQKLKQNLNRSPLQLQIYQLLARVGFQIPAKQIAKYLHNTNVNIYRPLNKLVEIGLLTKSKSKPATYKAQRINWLLKYRIPPEKTFIVLKTPREFEHFRRHQTKKVKSEIRMILPWRTRSFEYFEPLIHQAIKGKRIHIIYPKATELNRVLYKRLEKYGLTFKQDNIPGVTIIIYDDEVVQLALHENRNPKETKGIVFSNHFIAEYLKDAYDRTWQHAQYTL
jgi:sugar-specific transcriptional regulator TrmB